MQLELGASYNKDTNQIHFNLFSKNASHIKIYFYLVPFGADEVMTKSLARNNDVWSLALPLSELKSAGFTSNCVYYGYRAWGPNWQYAEDWNKSSSTGFICDVDDEGNRFNPNKLLIDPYSKELSHDPQVAKIYIDPNVYIDDYYGGANRNTDTGKIAPKSMLFLGNDKTSYGTKPKRHLKDDIIYEVNLRGLTMMDDSIPNDERGTYKAASLKAPYLKELGVTAIEFLPIQEFADVQNDDNDPRGDNYWGYMTLNFFSPNRRYSFDKSPGGPTREFKQMAKAFHDQGIKVFLDVVYNHTGEGILKRIINQGNPTTEEDVKKAIKEANRSRGDDTLQDYTAACIMSFTGLDNSSYYYLRDGNKRYEGRGGCGGNLKYDNEVVRELIYDSLKYWKDEMGVDGFRFDLAPVLSITGSNGNYWSDTRTTIFEEISNILPSRIKDQDDGADLIAEPWGEGSTIDWLYKFPDSWAVWNKAFRDIFKISINKYGIAPFRICDIANVSSGSSSIIKKKPWNSINYFVSHDDCNSLRNIFSYNEYFHLNEAVIKNDQITWDQGNDPYLQKKAVLNAFTLMMFSAGVPMFTGGDEFYRAISPYRQGTGKMNMVTIDGPDGYVDFQHFNKLTVLKNSGNSHEAEQLAKNTDELYIFEFVKKAIDFRNKHECLRPENYFKGEKENNNMLKDITWYQHNGLEINSSYWDSSDFIAYRISAESEKAVNAKNRIFSIYLAYNRSPKTEKILLPPNIPNKRWYRLVDTDNTNGWMSDLRNFDGNTLLENEYVMHDRSILVLIEKKEGGNAMIDNKFESYYKRKRSDIEKTKERMRLNEYTEYIKGLITNNPQGKNWRKWGCYLSERQWGTVRENYNTVDYSWGEGGQPGTFPRDQALNRAYRWGEDGIAGISDDHQFLCFAVSMWNGEDPCIKERLYGLTNGEGNHGEDVKEYYFYLDNTPTHSYMKYQYKYPYSYPYEDLYNKKGSLNPLEFELINTGTFEGDRYFDITIEYAKYDAEDILIKINAKNMGNEKRTLHLLPTVWFRNTWAFTGEPCKNSLKRNGNNVAINYLKLNENGDTYSKINMLYTDSKYKDILFTNNETDNKASFNSSNDGRKYFKNGINNYVIAKYRDGNNGVDNLDYINKEETGTKASVHYMFELESKQETTISLRLSDNNSLLNPFSDSEEMLAKRINEADEFYDTLSPYNRNGDPNNRDADMEKDLYNIQRQAFAGMLWNKQLFHFIADEWLSGDKIAPIPEHINDLKMTKWKHLYCKDILLMPDKWEYPWFAAWDLAFHTVTVGLIDPDFAKHQLLLMLKEWYMHPNGQIPAYEWDYCNINPPVHAWAALKVYEQEKIIYGNDDIEFLKEIFEKLNINFTWWINKVDDDGNNIFSGGFLGLDNIRILDRDPDGNLLEQADGTAWMSMFCLNMMKIAHILKRYEMERKYLQHFIYLSDAMGKIGSSIFCMGEVGYGFYEKLKGQSDNVLKYVYSKLFYDDKYKNLLYQWNEKEFIEAMNLRILPDYNFCKTIENIDQIIENSKNSEEWGHISNIYEKTSKNRFEIQALNRLLLAYMYKEVKKNTRFGLWDEDKGFFFDCANVYGIIDVCSVVGLVPLFAIEKVEMKSNEQCYDSFNSFKGSLEWFMKKRPELVSKESHNNFSDLLETNVDDGQNKKGCLEGYISIVDKYKLKRIMERVLDKNQFLSDYGIRSLSKNTNLNWYGKTIEYEPAESNKVKLMGGNSNWRGPIWFPINYLLIKSLRKFSNYLGRDFQVEYKDSDNGTGVKKSLDEVCDDLTDRLINIFRRNNEGKRPVYGGQSSLFNKEDFKDNILFYEYFHGDLGAGLGASHQTGWTGLVANLIQEKGITKKA